MKKALPPELGNGKLVAVKHLYDSFRGCAKEEEVKAEFCKFFKMKIFALRGIDHYTGGSDPLLPSFDDDDDDDDEKKN